MTPEALLCSEYPCGLRLLHVHFSVGHTVMPEQACRRSPSIKWTASSKGSAMAVMVSDGH